MKRRRPSWLVVEVACLAILALLAAMASLGAAN